MSTCTPSNCKHDDCIHLATIDVAKGICHLSKKTVLIDTPVCPKFTPLKKCGNCENFQKNKTDDNIGVCAAEKHLPWTYPDLIAQSCAMYRAG